MTVPLERSPAPVPPAVRRARDLAQDRIALERCAAGDTAAFEALYVRHAGACLAHALLLMAGSHHAQSVVQEVFLDLWEDAGGIDERGCTVRTWLLTLTHRKAADRAGTQADRGATAPDPLGADPDALLPLLGDDARRALAGLSAATRHTVVLGYWGGRTQTQVAELTGASLATVRTRMLAGLRALGPGTAGG